MNIRNRLTKLEVMAGPDPREVERERRRAAKRARVVRCEAVLRMCGEDTDMPPTALIGLQTVVDGDYWLHKGCHHPLAVFVFGELHDGRTDPLPPSLVAALLSPAAEFWGHCSRPEDRPYYADRLPPAWLDLGYRGCRSCQRKSASGFAGRTAKSAIRSSNTWKNWRISSCGRCSPRRVFISITAESGGSAVAEAKPGEIAVPTTGEGVRDLLKRAANGDTSTTATVRKLLEKPETIDMLGGDLARQVQSSFVNVIAGKDIAVREAVHAKVANLRKELLGENPTPIEVLLVERIAACWLQVQDAELRFAQAKDLSIRQADYHQRRMDATNGRYLSALKALATVRKLAIPALQINVAKKQVNVIAGD